MDWGAAGRGGAGPGMGRAGSWAGRRGAVRPAGGLSFETLERQTTVLDDSWKHERVVANVDWIKGHNEWLTSI